MPIPAIVPIAIAGASVVSSIASGMKGSAAAEKAGRRAARAIRLETNMQVRRQERDLAHTLGQTTAAIGSAGVEMNVEGSTAQRYLDASRDIGEQNIRDTKRSGRARMAAARSGASMQASSLMTQGISGGISGALSAFGSYKKYGEGTNIFTGKGV